jgi:hypothetical protein
LEKGRLLADFLLNLQSVPDLCHLKNDQGVMLIATVGVITRKDFGRLRFLVMFSAASK